MATSPAAPLPAPAPSFPSPSGEWSARYQQHLTRSAARVERTQHLNRELIRRVARGLVTPAALDSHFSAFLAANAVAYANRLADTSMRFLAGLIQAGTTYSYELVETITPGAAPAPTAEAPAFDPADWADWFQRLTDYAAAENAGVTAMLRGVMEKVATGELDPAGVEAVSVGFHEQTLPGSVSQLVGLYFDLLSGLDDIHSTYGEEYLQAVLGQSDPTGERARAPLEVTAPAGRTASVRLAVANIAAEPAALRCLVTDLRRADGVGPAFDPDITFRPERVNLAAGAETTIAVSIPVTEQYQPGFLYVGTLHVVSPTDTVLQVPLHIRASRDESP